MHDDRDDDPFDLIRFVDAQAPVYEQVHRELTSGRKTGHWMWFVFPQLAGLGHSSMSKRYAIRGHEEAAAYLAHPILGRRLDACVELVANAEGASALAILGSPDDLKFRSCLTLFLDVDPQRLSYRKALDKYFDGARDQITLELLDRDRLRRTV